MKIYSNKINFNAETFETTSTMQTDLGTFVSIAKVREKDKGKESSFVGADVAVLKNFSKYMRRKAALAGEKAAFLRKILINMDKKYHIDCAYETVDEMWYYIDKQFVDQLRLQKEYRKKAKFYRESMIKLIKQRRKDLAHLNRVKRKMEYQAALRKELEEDNDSSNK